jgi:hypothetical protein
MRTDDAIEAAEALRAFSSSVGGAVSWRDARPDSLGDEFFKLGDEEFVKMGAGAELAEVGARALEAAEGSMNSIEEPPPPLEAEGSSKMTSLVNSTLDLRCDRGEPDVEELLNSERR